MRRNLIIAAAVAMLCLVVFATTLVSQYTTSASQFPGDVGLPTGPAVPLSFTSSQLFYAPGDEAITRRHFDGVYEPSSSELVAAPFWFQNPHPQEVLVTVQGRSCTSCTSARLATIPAADVQEFQKSVLADMAFGANSPTGILSAVAATKLMKGLDWKQLDFDRPEQGVVVAPAPSPELPLWGILQLEIKVTAVGPVDRSVAIGTQLPSQPMVTQSFTVAMAGAAPFALENGVIQVGELAEGAGGREVSVTAWSATRDFDRFPPPAVAVAAKDGLVQVHPPVPLTREEMKRLEAELLKQKTPTRIRSGYRLPLTIHRKRPEGVPGVGAAEPEIGPFERVVQVAGPGNATAGFKVSGTVTGVVTLQGASAVTLNDFDGKFGVSNKTFTLISDRPEVSLAVAPETTPSYLKVTLGEPGQFGPTRRSWQLSVSVPPEALYGDLPRDAAVVLTGKSGGEPFRVRLPVKGKGYRRGL